MSFNIPAILILYLSFGIIQSKNNLPCYFAESDNNEPFVVDFIVNKNLNEAVILNTVVDPPQADLTILNVRSNNLPKINFSSAFELRHHANGQFMIILKPNFTLPPYPAHINETNLTLTVMCNKYSHHLLTLKIRQPNMYPPMFYNSPYKLHISQMIENGSYLESQILAIDWDPQKKYPITYKIISGNDDDTFSLVVSNTTFYNRRVLPSKTPEGRKVPIRWSHSQLPPIVNILVNKPLTQRQYNLIIEASDNNTPPLNSTVNLTIYVEMKDEIVPVFSEKEYKANYSFNIKAGEELVTDKIIEAYYSSDIETNEIILYVMEESDVASLFSMDLMKGKIKVRKDLTPDIIGGTVKIELRAYSANNPHRYATATLILNEDTSNIAAHFSPCYQDVSIRENSKNGTILTKLNVVGSYSKILLLDSNGIFTVNQRNEIIVHDDTLLDREQIPFLEMKAQLLYDNKVETLKKSPCSVAFINVTIMDENDNSPLFLKSSYHFGFSKIPNNNTEIGIIKAIDNDEGINADLEYTINEEKEKNLPFTLVYKDNGVAIVFEKKEPFQKINDYYTFVVEVSDLTDNPRTSKISVAVDFNVDVIGMRQLRNNTKSDSNESREGTGIDEDGNLLPGVLTEEDIDDDPITMNKNDEKKYSRHFESEKYIFDVFGVVDDNQFVGAVKVIDAEPGEDITYELEVTTPNVFEINSGTGEIFTGPVLRSMDHDGVEFVFEVSARRKHVKVAKTDIVVRMDSQRNIFVLPPRFEQAIYNFKIPENHSPGRIGIVKAHHRAEEILNDRTIYSILTLNEQSNYFVIDGNTGEINSTKSFDFEDEVTRFELKILGCLVSKPGLCGEADVLVSIVDMNDNSPIFNQEIYNLTVPMDLSAGSEIITLSAKDIDSGKNGQISYKLILNDTDKDIFSIDNITGTIYLEKEFEKRLVYQFEVEASDNGEPSLSSKAVINIVLGGSNPTAPEFDEFRYDINREAPIPAGVVLVQVHASDPDPGPEGIIKYQFGNASNVQMKKNLEKLSINEETGKISSIVELTANDGPIMQIIVEAIDQSSIFKRKSQTVVVIHIVSNQTDKLEFVPLPKIVYISSEKSLGSPIIRISAKSSLNELITFSLESDNRIKKYFMIEEDKLVLSRKLQPGEYILKMKASIRNDYLTASHQMKVVVMKDREKFPVFERLSYQFHIPINADFPLKLPKLNCTLANSPIEYSVFPSKDLPDGLNIDQVTGELTVNESFVLGYRKKGYVFVVVRARNMMSPQFFSDVGVTIKVDDTVFSSLLYRFTIDENTPVGSIINSSIKITNDENNDDRDIQYFVEPDDKFNIDKNGNLIVKKLIDLEKMKPESNGIINLNVIGKQNGETSSAKVQIKINDINEFPPQFVDEILKFTIDDENSKGDQLGTIAIRDEDFSGPGPLIFKFETQGQDVFVDIDNEGNVILKDNVNNIEIGEYELILTVKDKDGNEIEKLVTFERVSVDTVTEPILYEMEPIDWNVPDGSSFIGTKLLITMPLEENVTADWNFDILKGNEDNMFRVNRHNGSTAELEILTNDIHERLYLLDINGTNLANKLETMQLSVTVNFTNALQQFIPEFINEVPETVHISSDVNQTIPIFSATATVQADPNLPILYTVDSNSKEKIFSIDKDGNVYLVHVPNEEISRAYKVTVNAVSGTFKNEKVIAVIIDKFDTEETTINLLSTTEQNIISMTPSDTLITITPLPTVKFGRSTYNFIMDKNSERGEVVGKIDFNENDFNRENYKLKIDPEDYSLLFDADIDTGKVVMKRIPLSGWNRDDIKFNIKLIKINSENADIPTAHIEIQLQDVITTTNRIIIQPITSNIIASTTSNDMSQIDVTPSTVVMNSTLYTKESEYITTTQIGGIISLPDITNVTKRKIFETDVYYGEIKEGFYSTGVFVKLKPSNFKQEEFTKNNKVNYKIIYDNNNSSVLSSQFPIHVRRNNGDIIAIGDIDREKIDELKFFVEGTEVNNPTNKERVSVIIKILDVNDNKPIFENSTPIVLPVFSTTRPTEIIGTITAIDGDENESGKISYTLNDHGLNMFTIDKDNGNIILLKPLEYTNKTNFVDIIATDNGNPPLSTVYKLRIDTFPVNSDEEPLFNEGTYFYKIPYSHQLDIPFGQMVAGIGEYNYEIYPEDLFSIDKNNGKLYLSHSPTVEQCNTPQLVFVNATSKLSEIKASTTFEVTFDSCSSMKPNLQSTTGSPTSGQTECVFNSKVYSTEIVENAIGINKLLTLTSTCGDDAVYSIFQGEDKFVIDKNTGEFFVAKPLDYEIKTTHYVIVQVNYKYSEQVRDKRQPSTNKIIDDYVKNRLTQSQALIVIHVLNVNDNPPKFQNINKDMSKYIFYLNWKTKESEVVGNVRAFDADINDKIEYYLLRDEFDDYDYFHIDKDTGKIRLYKNVFYSDKSVFNVKIMATDSMNNVTTDALFYKIAPGVNIVSIGLNDTGNINENEIVRKLGTIVDKDIRLVNKQSVSGINSEDEQMNKTQLLVYGIDKKTNEPIKDDVLKTDFIGKLRQIHTSGIKVNSVSTLNNISHFGLSKLEYLLIILCVLLLLFTCCIFCLICYFCKRNKNISKNEKDYMIDVINAGPRPYNVELISRKNAQEILQSKDIPEPKEDVTDALEALYGKIDRTRKSNNNQKKNTNILDLKTDQTEYTHDRGISYDIEDPTQMIEASIINRAYSPNENEIEKGKPSLKKKIII